MRWNCRAEGCRESTESGGDWAKGRLWKNRRIIFQTKWVGEGVEMLEGGPNDYATGWRWSNRGPDKTQKLVMYLATWLPSPDSLRGAPSKTPRHHTHTQRRLTVVKCLDHARLCFSLLWSQLFCCQPVVLGYCDAVQLRCLGAQSCCTADNWAVYPIKPCLALKTDRGSDLVGDV